LRGSKVSMRATVTYKSPVDLKLRTNNPRTHTKRQIEQIGASIKEFGFINPILIDGDDRIIAGHGRVEAAKLIGMSDVPVIRVGHLTPAQVRAYVIADNKLAENAGWDRALLALELRELSVELNFDVTITGFETAEIDLLIEDLNQHKPDETDEVPELNRTIPAISRSGDLWRLGNHRLLCGDALNRSDYAKLLGSKKAQMVFTDPPYNVPIAGNVSGLGKMKHREFAMASGEMNSDEFTKFLQAALSRLVEFSTDGSIHFICMDWRHIRELSDAGLETYRELKNLCIWSKTNAGMGSLYRSQHELIFVFKNGSDPIKADDAQSDTRRRSVNEWYDNTLRSRLNNQETGAIIIVMQRLHADDLVAHVQQAEAWDVLSFPAIAEQDETHHIPTPYGHKQIKRNAGDVLHPRLLSESTLETQRRAMTEYNFTAQYQQNPQPPSGIIVKRDWLKFYAPTDRPQKFDQVVQSWDTANKDSELANFSVCTTWGKTNRHMYLLDVFRRKLNFPDLKRAVRQQANLYNADLVLVEDKASGTSLIQELQADGFWQVRAAPALEGDKIMRLHSQTAKIESGFALFPMNAPWLDTYLHELTGFPNAKHDDQVDSTVFALAWSTPEGNAEGWIKYYQTLVEKEHANHFDGNKLIRVLLPSSSSSYLLITGRLINSVPDDRIVQMTEEEFLPLRNIGATRID
jgi:predicted phage terminase large subunit-like protein